ncbi:uncharacterized protein N0V89_005786 [Didymosphaeria variabile]|uniref:Heterokaryon incompatibility domain-containing protein n=1 Tax=Didymosphaeria variabile TaxID=1932322 RepID=A0A9W9CC27_9PLEO|nr:uncharacterized protein N0V89_005786 [Didymosphaeria variabile]KAJ4354053.1 hypothetical protein N0V89_005786 [Didymosphaeria variabile]
MGNLESSLKGDSVVRSKNLEKQIDNLRQQQFEENHFIQEADDQLSKNKLRPGTDAQLWLDRYSAQQRKETLEEQIQALRSQAHSKDDAPSRPQNAHIRDGQIDWLQGLPEGEPIPRINSENLPIYCYDAFKQSEMIRLLILHPSSDPKSILRCSLRSVDQTEALSSKYEALSYTWGAPFFVHKMHLEQGCIKITESLNSALRALRLSDKPRVLWVDAVCIDQQNNAEKAQQLPHMSWIYASASQVVIWLDEDTDGTAKAGFEVARELHRLTWALGLPEATSVNEDQYEEYMPKFEANLRSMGCTQFFNILAKAWFTRTWTLQEVVLSSRALVLCGFKYDIRKQLHIRQILRATPSRKFEQLCLPFVKGTGDYQLIGECYLHGYMKGEENPEDRPQEEEQWFSLV